MDIGINLTKYLEIFNPEIKKRKLMKNSINERVNVNDSGIYP